MIAHTIPFGGEEQGVSVHGPAGHAARITAVGQVDNRAFPVGANQSDVRIRLVLVGDEFQCEPFPVGRPLIVKASRKRVPRRPVGHLAHLLALQVQHHEAGTPFDEGDFFPVGRELRIAPLYGFRGKQGFFFYQRGIGEILFFLA